MSQINIPEPTKANNKSPRAKNTLSHLERGLALLEMTGWTFVLVLVVVGDFLPALKVSLNSLINPASALEAAASANSPSSQPSLLPALLSIAVLHWLIDRVKRDLHRPATKKEGV